MTFEKATQADIGALSALRLAYLEEDFGNIPGSEKAGIAERLPAYFARHLDRDCFAFVCRDAGEIVGCCLLLVTEKPASPAFPTGRIGTVLNVYTKPAHRKKGVAGRLMALLLSEAKALGLDHVELKATDAGRRLYQTLGFREIQEKYHPMKFSSAGQEASFGTDACSGASSAGISAWP